MKFFKLYTPPIGSKPTAQIKMYYRGLPLFAAAVFEDDRYSFKLPLNLSDKMMAGDLYADLLFPERGSARSTANTPVSIVLSDRYD